jgi:hypothetical protein
VAWEKKTKKERKRNAGVGGVSTKSNRVVKKSIVGKIMFPQCVYILMWVLYRCV